MGCANSTIQTSHRVRPLPCVTLCTIKNTAAVHNISHIIHDIDTRDHIDNVSRPILCDGVSAKRSGRVIHMRESDHSSPVGIMNKIYEYRYDDVKHSDMPICMVADEAGIYSNKILPALNKSQRDKLAKQTSRRGIKSPKSPQSRVQVTSSPKYRPDLQAQQYSCYAHYRDRLEKIESRICSPKNKKANILANIGSDPQIPSIQGMPKFSPENRSAFLNYGLDNDEKKCLEKRKILIIPQPIENQKDRVTRHLVEQGLPDTSKINKRSVFSKEKASLRERQPTMKLLERTHIQKVNLLPIRVKKQFHGVIGTQINRCNILPSIDMNNSHQSMAIDTISMIDKKCDTSDQSILDRDRKSVV